MKLTNLTIKDLVTPETKLTFLVGAGCSVGSPSNLPAGKTMMGALIKYTCAESEIDKLLGKVELEDGKKLEGLRFEQLIEIIRDRLDPELRRVSRTSVSEISINCVYEENLETHRDPFPFDKSFELGTYNHLCFNSITSKAIKDIYYRF